MIITIMMIMIEGPDRGNQQEVIEMSGINICNHVEIYTKVQSIE